MTSQKKSTITSVHWHEVQIRLFITYLTSINAAEISTFKLRRSTGWMWATLLIWHVMAVVVEITSVIRVYAPTISTHKWWRITCAVCTQCCTFIWSISTVIIHVTYIATPDASSIATDKIIYATVVCIGNTHLTTVPNVQVHRIRTRALNCCTLWSHVTDVWTSTIVINTRIYTYKNNAIMVDISQLIRQAFFICFATLPYFTPKLSVL